MEIIEKYVYEVVRHLPENQREDIEKELRSNILDMLPENYTLEDAKKVLTELGNPKVLAKEYRGAKQYLIGPEFFETYLLVLKIVGIVLLCVTPFVAVITAYEKVTEITFQTVLIEIFIQLFTIGITGAFQAFGWVTVIFAVLERTNVSTKDLSFPSSWNVEDLKGVNTASKKKISVSDSVASIIFGIAFVIVMYFHERLLGWYNLEDGLSVTPLFSEEVIDKFFPFIVVLTAILVIVSILKLVYRRWNLKLAIYNMVYNIISIVFTFVFLSDKHLINADFTELIASQTDFTIVQIGDVVSKGVIVVVFIIALLIIWDTVDGFIRAVRNN